MNDLNNLYQSFQIQAVESVLDPTADYIYRQICRWYSKTFHTPLHQVYQLPLDLILQNYYEAHLEEIPYNELIDRAIDDFLPALQQEQDKEAEEYAKQLEEEQALTLAKQEANKLKNKIQSSTSSIPISTSTSVSHKTKLNKNSDIKQKLQSLNNETSDPPQEKDVFMSFGDLNEEP